jgi:hypothetical protein
MERGATKRPVPGTVVNRHSRHTGRNGQRMTMSGLREQPANRQQKPGEHERQQTLPQEGALMRARQSAWRSPLGRRCPGIRTADSGTPIAGEQTHRTGRRRNRRQVRGKRAPSLPGGMAASATATCGNEMNRHQEWQEQQPVGPADCAGT